MGWRKSRSPNYSDRILLSRPIQVSGDIITYHEPEYDNSKDSLILDLKGSRIINVKLMGQGNKL